MQIKDLKIGLKVKCPEDRGNSSYHGIIDSISKEVNYTFKDIPYVWVTIINPDKTKSIWSSNRIN